MSATEAWKQCGEPRGEKCIQNIRKRARELREKRLLDVVPHRGGTPAAAATPLPLADAEGGEGGGGEREANRAGSAQRNQPAFRLRGDQVQKAAQLHQAMKADFNTVYAAATLEWQQLVTSGRSGKGENSADAVAARFNLQLPDSCTRRLSGKILRNRVNEGKAGCGPGQTGPKRTIPDAFVRGLADYAQVHQLQGNEQKPRQLVAALVASAKGTIYEENLAKASQKRTILRRMRIEMGMATVSSKVIDDRRWKWLTSTNLRNWFVGYIQTLHQWGFIPSIPDDIFEIIVIDPEKAKRMLNGDESHQKLSNEGETAGPRSIRSTSTRRWGALASVRLLTKSTLLSWCGLRMAVRWALLTSYLQPMRRRRRNRQPPMLTLLLFEFDRNGPSASRGSTEHLGFLLGASPKPSNRAFF